MAKSNTEIAIAALVEAIGARMAALNFPGPLRNETLDTMLEPLGDDGEGALVNVCDGEGHPVAEMAGADVIENNGYDCEQRPEVEVLVICKTGASRDAQFDALLLAVHDAIRADRRLGGTVDWCGVEEIQRTNLATEGLPYCKAAIVKVRLTFTSDRPF